SKFVCKAALDAFGALNGGTYTDRMAQFHPSSRSPKWDNISDSQHDRYVECEDDWGKHGDGVDTDDTYPRNNSDPWTDRRNSGLSWSNTGTTYTVYDGNYVNWVNGPGAESTRLEIMQEVAVNLANSIG